MRKFVILGMVLAPLWATAALAETATPSADAAGKTTTKAAAATTHSPESLECSKRADAQGLHGKARKTFRSACKLELKKKS
jgi:psiF repeat